MLTEQVRVHENFSSVHLNRPRNILVYLPPGYGENPLQRYPVLYMHDGQNLVNPEEAFGGIAWSVDETTQNLILAGEIEPLIIKRF